MTVPVAQQEPIPFPVPPPSVRLSPVAWARANLLYSPAGVAMTLVFGLFAAWVAYRLCRFVFVSAHWEVVRRNAALFMTGLFPRDQQWRLWVALLLVVVVVALRVGSGGSGAGLDARALARRWWPLAMLAATMGSLAGTWPPVLGIAGLVVAALVARFAGTRIPGKRRRWMTALVAVGFVGGFELVVSGSNTGLDHWGGFLLTMYLAIAGIAISFPLGVLLALGRRSSLPAVRASSVAYIELFRGVPLVSVLFMAALLIGFFLPPGSRPPGLVTRALIGLVVFTAAYIAEIVRGGLQSVPRGQTEAAYALGLSHARTTAFIVLPQALRAVIPATVGQFISLFKDTSLVATIGLFELLSVAQTVTKQPDFVGQGLQAETLLFAAFVYWVGAYWMSRASQRLEARLGVGVR
jgi:general L-amino acid transport system permease protein